MASKRDTSLDALFRPRSVAIIGASRRPSSIGNEIVAKLVEHGFTGPVYPVNPKARVVRSMHCYKRVDELPDPVDLAVLVVPGERVLAAARACAKKGVKGLVVVSAGFREIGPRGEKRERELLAIARESGMRIIGPNCMGIVNTEEDFRLNASFAAAEPLPGRVAFASQSGALGEAILADARASGLGIRMFASVGNCADVGAHDLLEYWEHDDGVEIILLYLESFGDPARFQAVAERLRGKKHILAVKAGRSEAGARAAGSHTGSVVGSDDVVETFLAQCGVLRVSSMRELFTLASALLHSAPLAGEGVAVVTNAGGPGILATDALATHGLEPAPFTGKTTRRLERVLPEEASAANPVDLIASADAQRYGHALKAVVADPGVHALLVLFVSPIMIDAAAVARAILDSVGRGRDATKPLVVCLMGRQGDDEARRSFEVAGVPVFRFPEEAASTLAGMIRAARLAAQPRGEAAKLRVRRSRVRALLDEHKSGWLPAASAREVLRAYGLPVLKSELTRSRREALQLAEAIGYPLVVKADAKTLLHKSEAGAVRPGVADRAELEAVLDDFETRLRPKHRGLRYELQAMARGHRELLLGLRRDERFGPVLAVGMGGIFVEVLQDLAIRIGPLRSTDPAAMLETLRGAPLLGAFRGDAPVDRALLEDSVLRLDRLACDFPEIVEVDCNPMILGDEATPSWIVDVRMRIER